MGSWERTLPTSLHEHPVRCNRRKGSWAHGRAPHPRASTSILRAAQAGIAHVPMGEHPIHKHTSTLCSAHGSMGEHPIHEHPRASCGLHRQRSLMDPWESIPSTSSHEHPAPTSIHEHPGHCTGRDRSWAHGRAPYPRAFTSILCAAIVGKAHGPMGKHPLHEQLRASCALHT